VSITLLILFASITALATGLGVVPFAFLREVGQNWKALATAAASGLMLAASLMMLHEGYGDSGIAVGIGFFLGLGFVLWSQTYLAENDPFKLQGWNKADSKKMLLMVGVMTIHSFTEGVAIGVSFGDGMELGVFITAAIAVHNIPEGLAIGLVLIPRGVSIWKAAGWSVFSNLPQVLLAVPAYLAVGVFRPSLPLGLGFAAGAMIWMVFAELLPESFAAAKPIPVAMALVLSAALMIVIQLVL
jgi:zinc transporter ZupT